MGGFRILPNYTFEDYLLWEGKWELFDGVPFSMVPLPDINHQRIATALITLFQTAIDSANCDCEVLLPIDIKVNETTILNPDLIVVCQPISGQFIEFAPDIIVEILSPSTHLKDKHIKYTLYEGFGVKYYIMIDPNHNTIEVYQLLDGKYNKLEASQYSFTTGTGCTIKVDLQRSLGIK